MLCMSGVQNVRSKAMGWTGVNLYLCPGCLMDLGVPNLYILSPVEEGRWVVYV